MKTFYRLDNVGNSKYSISFHDGIKTHKDGSPFFDLRIFSNKKKMQAFIKSLIAEGYKYDWLSSRVSVGSRLEGE